MSAPKNDTSIALVNAVFRTFSLLERLAKKKDYSLDELSLAVGLAKPTTYRFLQTMQEIGYVRRDENDRYSITLKLFNVGSQALDHLDLHDAARPVARALLDRYGESVHMGVLDGDSAVYVLKLDSTHSVCMHSRVGRRVPLHCTAIGKVLLAWRNEEERASIVGGLRMVPYTEHSITAIDSFMDELARVRERGYALDSEEFEVGVRCIAAPVFDYADSCVAAISISRPRFRYDAAHESEWAQGIVDAAAEISRLLGRDDRADDQ
jgi:IclR family KDG regulon transcriptional repressor